MHLSVLLTAAVAAAASLESSKPRPFKVAIDRKLVKEAVTKAKLFRPSVDLEDETNDSWIEGPPAANMTALAKYWAEEYDWFKVQDKINAEKNHYTATVGAGFGYDHPLPLHFVHQRSARADAIPLILLHGWPSTHQEWAKVVKPLVAPKNAKDPAFHVVAPDLPGFGFSPAATHAGFGSRQAAAAMANLMQTLGYTKYGIASTDAGWYVAMWMVADKPEPVVGHFTDFFFAQPNATDLERFANNETDKTETDYMATLNFFGTSLNAYMTVQSQAPLKIGQVLNDSPVGLAGWIWHHNEAFSDGYHYPFGETITKTLLLWFQGVYGHIRTYTEWLKPGNVAFPRSEVPTGVSQFLSTNGPFPEYANFPKAPREWIERLCNLKSLVTRDFGGHYPAESQPELWVEDVQTFFGDLKVKI
ncbi:putative epoxide hydrolase [Paramyrothecium foliicola]|nr:putative epoxide hydrolase [Paramyrothecium foliicola]